MCGVAAVFGEKNSVFEQTVLDTLCHRGPDDKGSFHTEGIALFHRRLSIVELSKAGHQPMQSSCGRYHIIFNGEIYNHRELRAKYFKDKQFTGTSDTETIIELFTIKREAMLSEMIGMWALMIWDEKDQRLFVSRDRYGQKPLYYRREHNSWLFSSEIKPLLGDGEHSAFEPTALIEFLALGNYGHLGDRSFFKDIRQFPPSSYVWINRNDDTFQAKKYWQLPYVQEIDKRPFDATLKKELHDAVVEAVISQTLSDVPIGITLSGGIDSSIIAGILATHYNKGINVFTAQAVGSKFDESRYVNAVLDKYPHLHVHRLDLDELSLKRDVEKYVSIQEEPFGDPSIIAHGGLMQKAAATGIKVILGGQGADELFFGYTNMVQAILLKQARGFNINSLISNIRNMGMSKSVLARALFLIVFPQIERILRSASRRKRRAIISPSINHSTEDTLFISPSYDNFYGVWQESVTGIHLPHLVHYDDRNAMHYSIEGRMPFLDHRIAECVATIQPKYLLMDGKRKFPLREACTAYLPDIIKNRTDKIGFYTPLTEAIYRDYNWVDENLKAFSWMSDNAKSVLIAKMKEKKLTTNDSLLIWRFLVAQKWSDKFNILN